MITAIRAVRKARGLTLDDVARRCVPPTTAQTIGRLETGTRTVSVAWLNRIAAALGVAAADLVEMPGRVDLPVAATLDAAGARAPHRPGTAVPPAPAAGALAVLVTGSTGDYRAGDVIWCEPLAPDGFAGVVHRDVLLPLPAGRFAFGRLLAVEPGRLYLLAPSPGGRPQVVANPAWAAVATRLIRELC